MEKKSLDVLTQLANAAIAAGIIKDINTAVQINEALQDVKTLMELEKKG